MGRAWGAEPDSLSGKWAVITGATREVGRSIAIEFSKEGGWLILVGRDQESLFLPHARFHNCSITYRLLSCLSTTTSLMVHNQSICCLQVSKICNEVGSPEVVYINRSLSPSLSWSYKIFHKSSTKRWSKTCQLKGICRGTKSA